MIWDGDFIHSIFFKVFTLLSANQLCDTHD